MIELFTFWIAVCYFTMFINKEVALVRPKHICMKMDGIARFEIYIYFPEMTNFAFRIICQIDDVIKAENPALTWL